jgi:hypothetical protein
MPIVLKVMGHWITMEIFIEGEFTIMIHHLKIGNIMIESFKFVIKNI